jgi:hypothetical protein
VRSTEPEVSGPSSCESFPSRYYFYYEPGLPILDLKQIIRVAVKLQILLDSRGGKEAETYVRGAEYRARRQLAGKRG